MRRSQYRRASRNSGWFSGRRRIIAVAATLVAFGGIVTVTQVSNASTNRTQKKALSACDNIQAPPPAKLSTKTRRGTYTTNNGTVTQQRLHQLIRQPGAIADRTFEITFLDPDVAAYVFTFG